MSHPSAAPQPSGAPDHYVRVLRDIGFEGVGTHPFLETHDWAVESIVGFLYSTSVCSRRIIGADAPAFEEDLKAALLAHDPSGVYRETVCWGYTIGRKPS